MTRTVLTVTLLVAAVATAGLAQSRTTMRAKIPFKFSVGSQLLPSGNYTVARPGGSLVLIRADNGKGAAFTQSIGKQGRVESNQSKLVFRRYGDQYFLAQMWTKGEVSGLTFPVSSAEKKLSNSNLARNLAVNQEAETITVALD
ncbi:MAG: hypothetical protein ABI882_08355 [Acidobacteriota bacterium]